MSSQDLASTRLAMAAAVVGGVALTAGVAVSGTAAFFARRVVTPDSLRRDNVMVRSVGRDAVVLTSTPDTTAHGRYGLWQNRGAVHARLGDVLDIDVRRRQVTRRVDAVDEGSLAPGPGRWSAYYFAGDPSSALGFAHEDVQVSSDAGALPTWFVPPAQERSAEEEWAVLVHGHGGTREESLRFLPLLRSLGMPALVPSYRNSLEGPRTDGRYALGDVEWRDVAAAVQYAVDHGARSVVLIGSSMGGAICLQTVSRSPVGEHVGAVVLDSPVIDWNHVLLHNASVYRVPRSVAGVSRNMIADPGWRKLSGMGGTVVDLARLDWVTRAGEITRPLLILHGDADEIVPAGPSLALAQARPDMVSYIEFPRARHIKAWNTDPGRWEREVARFLLRRG